MEIMKLNFCATIFLLIGGYVTAQIPDYQYESSLDEIVNDWHSITIPDEVYGKVDPSLKDIRIYGVTKSQDTIEVPYLWNIKKDNVKTKKQSGKIINASKTDKGYYYTIMLNRKSTISHMKLLFSNSNYDWKVDLEASQDQKEWFTILENSRILDIENAVTDYSYTDLHFSTSDYQYYRILVKSNEQPKLTSVDMAMEEEVAGEIINYEVKKMMVSENKPMKYTEVELELENAVPVSSLQININADYDYFRPMNIRYLSDSVKTEKGYLYNYTTIKRVTLTSLDNNQFKFKSTVAKKFKIVISNGDNQPLNFQSAMINGFKHELIARFTEPASYKLVYGNPSAHRPQYDITNFKDHIPANLKNLEIGSQNQILNNDDSRKTSLFKSELWLWVIMGIIIIILGGFTYKMIGENVTKE
ncbi:DUF3999 family protein [Nonlabens mediterrranea]|uniref:DUF3999 family protein n=1 Tax=Nonlabens mediterrranea TaxID=1419947 RepID=A0ABS0A2H0_9FLAO|nr:DUF3999 family protein [Nonlabens mediterrranea]